MIRIRHNSPAYQAISFTGQAIIRVTEAILVKFAGKGHEVFDAKDFPWTGKMESSLQVILAELHQVLENYTVPSFEDISKEQERIVSRNKWKTFFLYAYGKKIESNALICPSTTELVEMIPGMTTAFFSILEPHSHIAPHRGPYKGVLRYHLGLIIPSDPQLCYIKILNRRHHWIQGKSLVFDDTFLHEAHNDSPEMRVILFVDFKRKFPFPINVLNNFILFLMRSSPFVANAVKNIELREYPPDTVKQP